MAILQQSWIALFSVLALATSVAEGKNCSDPGSCPPITNQYLGECGFLFKDSNKWCECDVIGGCGGIAQGTQVCCAASGDDCCELDVGMTGGIAAGAVVLLSLIITACCYCCKCGCFKPKKQVSPA
uniref:Uncharacterized protein n=1 Tax=Micromonas pusilla TaxID=38833 RepID=A0A7S0ILJ4_MICPS|mmetsp:Transcript_9111/g.37235  ORF Transcript_9111/g.37235 Transcript_9111/m.37235 type:complete len:126 (+) Transcript_9111:330-707(+)